MSDASRSTGEPPRRNGRPTVEDGYPPSTADRLEVNPRHFRVDHDAVTVEITSDRKYRAWVTVRDDGTRWEVGVDEDGRAVPIARYDGGHRRDVEDLPEWLAAVLRYVGVEVPER